MTKWKQNFRNVCKCIKKKNWNNHIYISIQTLYSVLSWSTFGSDYRLKSFWVWRNKLCTPGLDFLPFFFANPLKLDQVGWGPSVDSQLGLWLGHSRTFTELSLSHSCIALTVCLGLLSCWKVNFQPSLRSRVLWNRFSLRISTPP